MKNLENYGVQELNAKEVQSVEGGLMLGGWKNVWKLLNALGVISAAGDALEEFGEGWNSVECGCE